MVDVRSDIHPTTSLQLPRPMDSIPAQSAFVLHSRPSRESSALVDFLPPQGRFRRGLRGARGKAGRLARPFVPLEVECGGRGDLKSVARLERAGRANWLDGNALFSGMYLNEL